MDNASDPTITFDAAGRCNYCTDVLRRMPDSYFPNEEGRRRLGAMVAEIKEACKDSPYDCIVGISGGIDSSYILYWGWTQGLRMLGVHVDDGLDNPIATENLKKLVSKTGVKMVTIQPDMDDYRDILCALFKGSLPNLAVAQDNLIIKALQDYAEQNGIRYSLDGSNIAHESILERGKGINACDGKFIKAVHKKFGVRPLRHTEFLSLEDRYLRRHRSPVTHLRPLNYMDYNLEKAIGKLHDFCGFEYYGGKHYESILTRFLQCYYLPVKFGKDKRKSHYSSLVVSGQMTRDEALALLKKPLYPSEKLLQSDKQFLADYCGVSLETFEAWLSLPPREEYSIPHSILNHAAPIARKFRKILE